MSVKTYQYRLEPTQVQRQLLGQFAGNRRKIWNMLVDEQKKRRDQGRAFASADEMDKLVTFFRGQPATAYLKQSHVHTLQSVSVDMAEALSQYRKGNSEFPTFKGRNNSNTSFRYKSGMQMREGESRIFLPKIGWLRYRNSRDLPADAKVTQTTVKRQNGHWLACVVLELPNSEPLDLNPAEAVGVDLGVVNFATCSDGIVVKAQVHFTKLEKHKVRTQRCLDRKKEAALRRDPKARAPYSQNWIKQKRKLGKICAKEARCRKDFLHKVSTNLVKEHDLVVLEDLEIKKMTRSARGTTAAPGKNVQRRATLNRRMLDVGAGSFRSMVGYKLAAKGGQLLLVPAAYTSQTCFCCKHCCPGNRLSQAVFHCVACGHEANADYNAALNILAAGQAVFACGGRSSPVVRKPKSRRRDLAASKQEPASREFVRACA